MRAKGPVRFVLPDERVRRSRKAREAEGSNGASAPRRQEAPATEALDPAGKATFERLRTHRASVAKANRVPAYVVAFDRTLVEMVVKRPTSHAELLGVYGMGPARVEQYGDGFLEVLRGE
jgi:ATP-dependent DNA helicase RecQ